MLDVGTGLIWESGDRASRRFGCIVARNISEGKYLVRFYGDGYSAWPMHFNQVEICVKRAQQYEVSL